MGKEVQVVLAAMEEWGRENDAGAAARQDKMLNLEPDTARLLAIMARSGRRTRLLEVGTSNGYSTIWLAWAARQTGGSLVSIERRAARRILAQANLRRAELTKLVTLLEGEAAALLPGLTLPFDFVFLDADRESYLLYLRLLLPLLTPDALILADNVHSHPQEISPYLDAVEAGREFDHVVVGVGKGLSVAYRRQKIEPGR